MAIATRAENLDLAISQVCALLKQLTVNPKPTYSLDGESYSWESYFSMLTDKLLALEQARQRADGPFEVRSTGY